MYSRWQDWYWKQGESVTKSASLDNLISIERNHRWGEMQTIMKSMASASSVTEERFDEAKGEMVRHEGKGATDLARMMLRAAGEFRLRHVAEMLCDFLDERVEATI